MRKKLINNINNLFSLANIVINEETTREEVFPKILITLRRLEDLNEVSAILVTSRYLFLHFDEFKKYYLKHQDKFVILADKNDLLKEEESISCFISDMFSKKNELVFFSDALYEDFYFMKQVKNKYHLTIDDKVKYILQIKKNKFKLFDENNELILQAKAKSEKRFKFKKNKTPYEFIYNKKFKSFEIYTKEYLEQVKHKKDADYENNSVGVFEGQVLKIKHSRMEKYKFVVSKTTYFKDLNGDNILLNIIAFALISISRNIFLHYFK